MNDIIDTINGLLVFLALVAAVFSVFGVAIGIKWLAERRERRKEAKRWAIRMRQDLRAFNEYVREWNECEENE